MFNFFRRIPILLGSMLFPLLLLAQAGSFVEGRVTDNGGKPLEKVAVYSWDKGSASTDADGLFRLSNPGQVIHFWKDGFTPQTLVLDPKLTKIDVALRPSDPRLVPECARVPRGRERFGESFGVQFDVPVKSVRIRKLVDIDFVVYFVSPKKSKARVELWFGGHAMRPDPNDDLFIGSRSVVQRDLSRQDGFVGLDSRGENSSGTFWRHTVIVSSGAIYKDTSLSDAVLFDEIIDSMCYIPYPSEKKKEKKR